MEKMPAPHGNRSEKIPVKSAGKTLIRPAGRNRFITLRVRSFFDTTLWGSGKHGIMLGHDDITCLGGDPDKFRVLWSNVTSLWHHKGYLYVNDYKTGFVANNEACELLELLEEHYKKTKRSDGNILLTWLGYGRAEQQAITNAYQADVQQFIE